MPSHVDMELGGRGLALVPSVFIGRDPSLHENPNDEDETPRLVLPAADVSRASLWERRRSPGAALAALVGRNRAAVLASVADGCTTTELAREPASRSPRPASTRRSCAARAGSPAAVRAARCCTCSRRSARSCCKRASVLGRAGT